MKKQLKRGDKITVVSVNSCACTTIIEYTIDSIADDGRLVYAKNRKRFFLPITQSSLVLKGHSLGIKEGTYKDGTAFNIDAYCNLGGLDRESMKALLESNINKSFDEWDMIRWYDGASEVGDPLFATTEESVSTDIEDVEDIEVEEAEIIEPIIEESAPQIETKKTPKTTRKTTPKTSSKMAQKTTPKTTQEDYSYLTAIAHKYDKKTAATNLRKVLKRAFPDTKFSVVNSHAYYYVVNWVDGPTVEMVNKFAKMFEGGTFDPMTDCSDQIHTTFTDQYGWLESVSTQRKVSDKHKMAELEILNKERGTTYSMNDYIADENGYVSDIIYRRTRTKDYTIKVEPVIKKSQPSAKAKAVKPIESEGLEIKDYSEKSFVVIGNTKPIKETLKKLGGRFNSFLTCGAGWVFTKHNNKLEEVKQTLSIA